MPSAAHYRRPLDSPLASRGYNSAAPYNVQASSAPRPTMTANPLSRTTRGRCNWTVPCLMRGSAWAACAESWQSQHQQLAVRQLSRQAPTPPPLLRRHQLRRRRFSTAFRRNKRSRGRVSCALTRRCRGVTWLLWRTRRVGEPRYGGVVRLSYLLMAMSSLQSYWLSRYSIVRSSAALKISSLAAVVDDNNNNRCLSSTTSLLQAT